LFGKEVAEQSACAKDAAEPAISFSTDLRAYRMKSERERNQWIHDTAFPVTHKDFRVVNKSGVAVDAVAADSHIQKAFALGQSASLSQATFSYFVTQGFIGYQACALIAQNGIVNKCCTIPAKDAIKNGYKITVNDGSDVDNEIIEQVRKTDKRFKINKNLIELEKFNRVYGVRVVMFIVDSKDKFFYEKPFNFDSVTPGSYKGFSQIDPMWATPLIDEKNSSNAASPSFWEPTWYEVAGFGRVHKSHLVIAKWSEVGDPIKPSYQYGGLSLTQVIYERIYAAERTANEAPMLAMTKRMNVVKTDLDKVVANQAEVEERAKMSDFFRDNYAKLFIGLDDEYFQVETSLSDLDSVIMTQYQLVAALAGMHSTKLLEISPKGFNASGRFEQETYYDTLECIQEETLDPFLDRHYELLIRSEIAPLNGIKPFTVDISWNPLESLSATEIAAISETKSRTDVNYKNANIIDDLEIRDRLISDPDSGYNGIPSWTDEEIDDNAEKNKSRAEGSVEIKKEGSQ
jgi:phage-related protein (TIGR01555 family)